MTDSQLAFGATAEAAQRAAGVIAARHRGDLAGVESLFATLDDRERAAGCLFLSELAVCMLAHAEGRDIDDVAAELSLQIAELAPGVGT